MARRDRLSHVDRRRARGRRMRRKAFAGKGATMVSFPEPPSINHYWRVARGITHLSKDGRRWKDGAVEIAKDAGLRKVEGKVAVCIEWHRSRRSGDLDNRIKVVLDALRGLAYKDDKQVVELHAWRFEDKQNPRADVYIWEVGSAEE